MPLTPHDGAWDEGAAAHLLRRAGFGAPPDEVRALAALTPREAASRVVTGIEEDDARRELDGTYETLLALGDADAFRAWLLARAVRCRHQLREKLALFWHGHFATALSKVGEVSWMARQYRLFLDLGAGRYGALLDAVARDPAMIRWLDQDSNVKGRPNENFARELFELFALGEGNYTERDIREAARAFTGWRTLRGGFHFSRALHDEGEKRVFGRAASTGEDVLRLVLEQPACARFLSRKLLVFFAEPEPAEPLVDAFAARLREKDYDVGASLETLFASRAFFAPRARRALVASPVEFAVGAIRALGLAADPAALLPYLRETGQEILEPPNVRGWVGGESWVHTASWLARCNLAHELTRGFARPAAEAARALRVRVALPAASPADAAHALLCTPEAHRT